MIRNPGLGSIAGITFRIAAGTHLTSLYVLNFVLKNTLFGFWHEIAVVILSGLMVLIPVLYITDMLTPREQGRKINKFIDILVAGCWLAIVGVLAMNSWRAGR